MGIKLTGVNLGYMGLDKELMAFPNPELVLHASKQQGQKQWYQCPSLGFIIDHPDGRILWNTGLSKNWDEEWLAAWKWLIDLSGITPEVNIENRLKQLNLGPDDFTYVVQGHLHCDHAGGLRFFQNAGAEILVHEDEWKHVQQFETADQFFVRKDWNFMTDQKKPTLIYKDQELMKDVHLVHLPGHTPGTTGVLLKLERTGWVLLTDDALYIHESYGPPATGTPITWDVPLWGKSVERIRQIATDHDAFIFPNHDETGIKVSHDDHQQVTNEFRKIEFHPFTTGYVYE
jgi:N-acyl homoserine lactone hydrolase